MQVSNNTMVNFEALANALKGISAEDLATQNVKDVAITTDAGGLTITFNAVVDGKDVPIVWVYNLMVPDAHGAAIHVVIKNMGGEANGLYYLELVLGQNGGKGTETGNNHPSYGDHQINAERLTAFLREKGLVG